MKQLLIFLTHNFEDVFKETLEKIDASRSDDLDVIVLFDNSGNQNPDIALIEQFQNIKIVPIQKIPTSYDRLGHTLYLNYFRKNQEELNKYDYVWIIENDVYFHGNFKTFINKHNFYKYDLMVPEYGTRATNWHWMPTLRGFTKIHNIGVMVAIMRMSKRLLATLLAEIDLSIAGYVEAVLPHICIDHNFSIQCFLPELCGVITTNKNHPLLKVIKSDIANKTELFIEKKYTIPSNPVRIVSHSKKS